MTQYNWLFFSGLCLLGACSHKAGSSPTTGVQTTEAGSERVTVINADNSECMYGGSVIVSYLDSNSNNFLDNDEEIISRSKICNGAPGANGGQGYGAGILVENASVVSCAAGGSVLTTFIDMNNDGLRQSGESVTSVTTLCNGVAGANGSSGNSAHLSVTQASPSQCSAGGFVYTSSVDGDVVPDINIICNGSNGSNGSDGQNANVEMGAVGVEIAGRAYSACHHDYLYIPDADGGDRGWLTFRHQANGAADQGIGSTGFQIWNVDIADFNLVSEGGAVTYCSLHWDAQNKTLNYTVVDNSDGLAGTSGQIVLE